MVSLKPHDTLVLDTHVWSVTGEFLGGASQESLIGLEVTGNQHDPDAYGQTVREMFVPEILIRRAVEAGIITVHRVEEADRGPE